MQHWIEQNPNHYVNALNTREAFYSCFSLLYLNNICLCQNSINEKKKYERERENIYKNIQVVFVDNAE